MARMTKKRRAAPRRAARLTRFGAPTGRSAIDLAIFAKETASGRNWGHTGQTRILKGIGLDEAMWKPTPQTLSIWEEVNHTHYWSEDVLMQLEGRGAPRQQAWPAASGGAEAWRRDLARTKRVHAALVRRIQRLTPAMLAAKSQKTRFSNAQLILGGVAHTAYHTGRIALLRKMYREATETGQGQIA
jgi:DinB family protein